MRWEETTLGEACELYQPKTISGKEMVADGAYPVFGANGIIGRYDRYNHEAPQLVIGCRGSCGSVHVTDPYSWITGNTMVVKPRTNELDLKFMEYMLRGGVDISETITGAAQPQITRQSLAPVRISYPPLPEQQRIVGKLDAAFAALTEAQAHVERNLANARELFESYLNGVFEGKGDGWVEKPMGDVCDILNGSTPARTNRTYWENGTVPWFTIDDMREQGTRIRRTRQSITDFALRDTSVKLLPPKAVLLCCTASVGAFAIAEIPLTTNQQFNGLVVKKGIDLDPYFLMHRVSIMKEHLLNKSGKTTIDFVPISRLREITISYPVSLHEQRSIVKQLDQLQLETMQLETTYQQKLAELAGLKKAVLGAAFRGEL